MELVNLFDSTVVLFDFRSQTVCNIKINDS